MGTGIIPILIQKLPYQVPGFPQISLIFFILEIIIFVTLCVLSIVRYTVWPEIITLTMRHPVESLYLYDPSPLVSYFRGTMPTGLATIVTVLIHVAVPLSEGFLYFTQILFWITVGLSLLSCIGIPLLM